MSPVLLKFSLLAPGSALWDLWGNLPASLWTLGQLWEPVDAHMWCLGPVRSTRLYCPLVESDMLLVVVGTLLPTDHPHSIQHSHGMNSLQRDLLPCSTWEGGHLVTSRMPASGTLMRCRWARLSCRTCRLHPTLSNQETATSEQQKSCPTPNTLTIPSSTFTPASLQICLNLRVQRFNEDSLKLTLRTRSCLIIQPEFIWPVKCLRLLDRLMWTSEITHKVTAGFFTFVHKKVVAENTSAESETVKPLYLFLYFFEKGKERSQDFFKKSLLFSFSWWFPKTTLRVLFLKLTFLKHSHSFL